MPQDNDHLHQSVMSIARRDAATLQQDMTVQEALNAIRERGIGEKIVYFYVVDAGEKLKGVLPTRRLLTAPLEQRLSSVMISRVVAIPERFTVLEACEAFVMHKFLAFPVVDHNRKIVGVIDVSSFAEEVFDLAERAHVDDIFETIGFRVSQLRDASPLKAFRFRFPWLLATLGSGLICAFLASAFETTLASSILLAFFLTLVLGLGESVSIQSMTVTIQALRSTEPTLRWYVKAFWREFGTALLLGAACGLAVAAIVWLWRGEVMAALAIGSSILLSLAAACFFGLTVPSLLHALKLDPKIAAGPVTLAVTDIFTLLFYFAIATMLL